MVALYRSLTSTSSLTVTFTAAGACTVLIDTVTLTGAGSCAITAHQAGHAAYSATPDVIRGFIVAGAEHKV
jgi:hypothetical protein